MKTTTKMLLLTALFAVAAMAQSDSFTFGPTQPNSPHHCSIITSWNGDPNAFQDMGSICLALYPYGTTDFWTPASLGFPNGGALTQGATYWGPLTWASGCGYNIAGCTATQPFTANQFYNGGNTTVNATVSFVVVETTSCGHGHCTHNYHNAVTGGSGTVTNTP
jgi:hypothetical protein